MHLYFLLKRLFTWFYGSRKCSLTKANQVFYLEVTHDCRDNIWKTIPICFLLQELKIPVVILILGKDMRSPLCFASFSLLGFFFFFKVIPQLKWLYKEGERRYCLLQRTHGEEIESCVWGVEIDSPVHFILTLHYQR